MAALAPLMGQTTKVIDCATIAESAYFMADALMEARNMNEAYWIEYALQWLTVLGGLALASPILISAYVIIKNDGKTNVELRG
jgi:hypothetical protein